MRTHALDIALQSATWMDNDVTDAETTEILTTARRVGVTEHEVTRLREWLTDFSGTISDSNRARLQAVIDRGATARPVTATPARDIDYDRLTADRRVEIGLAVGYDDGSSGDGSDGFHHYGELQLRAMLLMNRFSRVDTTNAALCASLGISNVDPNIEYYARLDGDGMPIHEPQLSGSTVTIRLLVPGAAADASRGESLRALFASSEVFAYTGHGRYGSGPDIDSIGSPAGNFRISSPYAEGYVTLPRADHLAAPEMTALDYQIGLFAGCTTDLYLSSLRRHGLSRRDHDFFVTNQLMYADRMPLMVNEFVSGILAHRAFAPTLDKLNRAADEEGGIVADGFGGLRAPAPEPH